MRQTFLDQSVCFDRAAWGNLQKLTALLYIRRIAGRCGGKVGKGRGWKGMESEGRMKGREGRGGRAGRRQTTAKF